MSSDEEDLSENEYYVEYILGARAVRDDEGKDDEDESIYPGWEYLVKWDGYPEDEAEWKHGRHLGHLSRLLKSFWKEVNHDDGRRGVRDYKRYLDVEETLTPTEEWIKKESKRFQAEKRKDQEEARRSRSTKSKDREEVAAASTSKSKASKKSAGGEKPRKSTARTSSSSNAAPHADSEEPASEQSRSRRSTRPKASATAPAKPPRARKRVQAPSPDPSIPSAANSESDEEDVPPRPPAARTSTNKPAASTSSRAVTSGRMSLGDLTESTANKSLKSKTARGNVVQSSSEDEEDVPLSIAVMSPTAKSTPFVATPSSYSKPNSSQGKKSVSIQNEKIVKRPSAAATAASASDILAQRGIPVQKGVGLPKPRAEVRKPIAGATKETSTSTKAFPSPPVSSASSRNPLSPKPGQAASAVASGSGYKKTVPSASISQPATTAVSTPRAAEKELPASSANQADKEIDALFGEGDVDMDSPSPQKPVAPAAPPPGRKTYKAAPRPVFLYDESTGKTTQVPTREGPRPNPAKVQLIQPPTRHDSQSVLDGPSKYTGMSFKKKSAPGAGISATTSVVQEPSQEPAAASPTLLSSGSPHVQTAAMKVANQPPPTLPSHEELSDYEDEDDVLQSLGISSPSAPASPSARSPPGRGMHPPLPEPVVPISSADKASATPPPRDSQPGRGIIKASAPVDISEEPEAQPDVPNELEEAEDGEVPREMSPMTVSETRPARPRELEMDKAGWPKPLVVNGSHLAFVKLMSSQHKHPFSPSFGLYLNKQMPKLNINNTFSIASCTDSRNLAWNLIQHGLIGPDPTDRGAENDLVNFAAYLKDHDKVAVAMHPRIPKYGVFLFSLASWKMMQAVAIPIPEGNVRSRVVIILVEFKSPWPSDSPYRETLTTSQQDKPFVRHIITKLHFPEESLRKTVVGRSFSVVPQEYDVDPFVMSDGKALVAALEEFHGRLKPISEFNEEEGVVFIHKRVLSEDDFTAQFIRLKRFPRVKFYAFGYGFLYPPDLLPIFCIGGIVTFTPQAILEDFSGVTSVATVLTRKPDWQCYVSPATLASVHSYAGDEQGLIPIPLMDLLMLATARQDPLIISECPFKVPAEAEQSSNADAQHQQPEDLMNWLTCQYRFLDTEPWDILNECGEVAKAKGEPLDAESAASSVLEDMMSMQKQPRLVELYRRFIVITSSAREGYDFSNRVECCTLSEFTQSVPSLFASEPGEIITGVSHDPDITMD